MGMAKGTNYSGPFEDMSPNAPLMDIPFEDQTLWIDRRGNFHMIVHQIGHISPTEQDGSLGHVFSPNGIDSWKISADSPLPYRNAGAEDVKHIARPFVHVVDGVPQYISYGAKAAQPGDHTTTPVLPLRTAY